MAEESAAVMRPALFFMRNTKIRTIYLRSTKIRTIFVVLIIKAVNNMETMKVTEQERELIEGIRNYNKSFPDGYPELLWYLQQLFDSMVKQPY